MYAFIIYLNKLINIHMSLKYKYGYPHPVSYDQQIKITSKKLKLGVQN